MSEVDNTPIEGEHDGEPPAREGSVSAEEQNDHRSVPDLPSAGDGSALDNVVVVLDHPQTLINIAGVIRAMKNMGISKLRVVNPAEWDAWRIDGIAHRTTDIVEATGHFETLEEALADCVWVVGTSARNRTANRNYTRPHAVAPNLIARAAGGRSPWSSVARTAACRTKRSTCATRSRSSPPRPTTQV